MDPSDGWTGDARLYKLSESLLVSDALIPTPLGPYEYLVVSAADLKHEVALLDSVLGTVLPEYQELASCETMAFGVTAMGLLSLTSVGTLRGEKNHKALLRRLGYELVED